MENSQTGFFILSGELIKDSEVNYFLSAFNKVQQSVEYGLTEQVLKLIKVDSEFKFLVLFEMIEHIKSVLSEHEERKAKRLNRGDKHRR